MDVNCNCYAMFGQPHFHDCPAFKKPVGIEKEEQKPCPVCGNEEHHARTGLLTCECPAPLTTEQLKGFSDDLLLDNFHWTQTSNKHYDLFRAELVRRLQANR